MVQVLIAVAVVGAGVVVAYVIRRRDAGSFTRGERWSVPAQLERTDFDEPHTPRIVVVFTSETCDACATTWERVLDVVTDDMARQQVSYQDRRDLHDRYGIDAVPTVVVADLQGVVEGSFVGPPSVDDLTEMLARRT